MDRQVLDAHVVQRPVLLIARCPFDGRKRLPSIDHLPKDSVICAGQHAYQYAYVWLGKQQWEQQQRASDTVQCSSGTDCCLGVDASHR